MHLEIENERQQLINIQLDNQIKQDQVEQINLRKDHEKNAVKEQILRKNISENDVEISEIKHILLEIFLLISMKISSNIPIQTHKASILFLHSLQVGPSSRL